jgi:hypothetical protein
MRHSGPDVAARPKRGGGRALPGAFGATLVLGVLSPLGALAAEAAPSPAAPASDASLPSLGLAPEAPLELDGVAFTGETRAPREARGRLFEGLVLLSAADGVGAGGQVHYGIFGLRATLAYQPLMFLVDADPADKEFGSFEFSNSIQLNLDAMLVDAGSGQGGSIGYRINDVLGHGVSVAYQSMFEAWGERFSLSFPVTYYPQGTSRVRERFDIEHDYKINFPFGAGVQFGVGAAWVL